MGLAGVGWGHLWRRAVAVPFVWLMDFQAETFAKVVTDGASAARRHLGKPIMRCLKYWRRAVAVPFVAKVFSTLRVALRYTPLYPNQRFGQMDKAAIG